MIMRAPENEGGYRQLNLVGFTLDIMQPLALFKDDTGEMTVPLWLAMDDVLAVTAELVSSKLSGTKERHDLLDALLIAMGMDLREILVDGSAAAGYRVNVRFSGEGGDLLVKVGLVTALLAAIRYKIPMAISAEAISSSSLVDQRESSVVPSDSDSQLLDLLEKLRPEEMGKYPM